MAKRKISLEEAFAAFEEHGIHVEVKGPIQPSERITMNDFRSPEARVSKTPIAVKESESNKSGLVKIPLFAAHTIGNGGEIVVDKDGSKKVVSNGVQQYGPGIVTVPIELADHLLYQDMLARQADERMLDRRLRSYVVVPRRTSYGVVNAAILVSEDSSFDMSSFLGQMGNNNVFDIRG